MVQLFLRTLGYAKDSTPITGANYNSMRDTRKWRTSFFVPFGANFAAIFYRYFLNCLLLRFCKWISCNNNVLIIFRCDSSNKVRFYLNEKPLDYEGCDNGICDWEYLKKKLGSIAFNCNADFCRQPSAD